MKTRFFSAQLFRRPVSPPGFLGTLLILAVSLAGSTARADAPLTTLATFTGDNGAAPETALVLGTNGNFYGTTANGGADGFGTVFEMTPTGLLTLLVSFDGVSGNLPGPLARATNGNFYGTTLNGGPFGLGNLYEITEGGDFSNLFSFNGDDGSEPVGLTAGPNGTFYGVTTCGGTGFDGVDADTGYGTVFSLSTNGTLSTLVLFNTTNGAVPEAPLVLGQDGNFYGTTAAGGFQSTGTIFQLTASGVLTSLFSSDATNATAPSAALVEGPDGDFYGTTVDGGIYSLGGIFKIGSSGSFTLLFSFSQSNGANPAAPLALGTDGNFYGTTSVGGDFDDGTVFSMTPAGVLTTLVSFAGTNGMNPMGGLIQGFNGSLYGSTSAGGSGEAGTIFEVSVALPPPAPVFQKVTPSGGKITLTWSAVAGHIYQLQSKSSLTQTSWTSVSRNTAAGASLTVTDPNAVSAGQDRFYRVVLTQ